MSPVQGQFKDHFSGHARSYAAYRPGYPSSLFEWLAGVSPATTLAWDCATGNGQAAHALAGYFDRVIATDASAEQVNNARSHSRVEYRVEPAENTSLANASVELVTVGQAYHWFGHDAFNREAGRVLKPRGVLAIWTYKLATITPAIDGIVYELYDDILGAYWPPERRYIDRDYRDFDLPWNEIQSPVFTMQADWNLAQMVCYLETWSALRRYAQQNGSNPLDSLAQRLAGAWGNPDRARKVTWPLILRASRKST